MSTKPKRFQPKRGVKGWRMPPNSKSVARPHKWHNPSFSRWSILANSAR
jgi:hypothetical protein